MAELDALVEMVKGHLERSPQTLSSLMRNLNHRYNAVEIRNALLALNAEEEETYLGREGRGRTTTVYSLP